MYGIVDMKWVYEKRLLVPSKLPQTTSYYNETLYDEIIWWNKKIEFSISCQNNENILGK